MSCQKACSQPVQSLWVLLGKGLDLMQRGLRIELTIIWGFPVNDLSMHPFPVIVIETQFSIHFTWGIVNSLLF